MIKLTITEKGGEPRALSFDQNEVSIGRVQGNDIVLPKGNISKRHSKLTLADGRITVADIKSTNGTYVNGRKIGDPTPVRPGDKIFVGDFLIVVDPGAASAETSSTGSRRGPPPPPPPPRPGSAMRHVVPTGLPDLGIADVGDGFGNLTNEPASIGRGRPPAPPPPPPRRTIVTTSLQDDSVDIGLNDAPPSPDEVDAGIGDMRDADADSLAGLSGDVEDVGRTEAPTDTGNDVFGSRPAHDEDAPVALGFPPSHPKPSSDLADQLTNMPTPAPSTESARAPTASSSAAVAAPHSAGGMSLEAALADPTVTSIVIATGGAMLIDRAGKIETIPAIGDGNAIAETVWQIANTAVPPPPSDNPVVDVRLLDGTRVTALFPPISASSVCAAIRKVTTSVIPLADIAGSADVESILRAAVLSRRNLLLAGDRPAVATLLASLAEILPDERRVISIGAGIKAQPGWIELGPGLDPAALARAAVAFRADHMLFADSGGTELPELLLGAARGQEGVIACMAARSATEALGRLRGFAVGSLGASGFSALLTGTIDLIVLAGTLAEGRVQIVELAEPQAEGETVVPSFVARRPDGSRAPGALNVAGVSTRLAAAIATSATALPGHLIRH